MTVSEEQNLKNLATHLLATRKWIYVGNNPIALAEMERRAQDKASKKHLIPYSNLVYRIDFNISTATGASTYRINVDNWLPSDGAIVGEFLDYLSLQSCVRDATLLAAHIVSSGNRKPGPGFYQLGNELGLFEGEGITAKDRFWKAEMGYLFNPLTKSNRIIPFA